MKLTKLLKFNTAVRLACMALPILAGAASVQAAPTITVLSSAPVPGPDDQYQLVTGPYNSPPPGGGAFNYYMDNAPGQTFTTGSNPTGYTMNSLALYDAANSGGNFSSPQTFTLYIYTVNGSTATPLANYTSQSVSLTDNKWFQWTGLSAILQPNTQYAFMIHRNGSGWANLGNVSGNNYAGGQVAIIPAAGGTMTFSTDANYDASFDVGLTAITAVTVSQPMLSPQSVFPGDTVTASATVGGPTPYYYQWQTDGGSGGTLTNIPNATNPTLSINTTGLIGGNYKYGLVVSNNNSTATSPAANLTVVDPVGIPGVIGIKFGFTGGYSSTINLDQADLAGVVPVMRWNNLLANVQDPKGTAERAAAINQTWNIPHDSANNPLSGVTLTAAGFNDGWNSGGTSTPNGRLLFNSWKWSQSNGTSDGKRCYVTLTIANLPKSTYDVYLYVHNNSGNYWGNAQANSICAVGNNLIDFGFNGDNADPGTQNPQLHTASGYGSPANYVKMANVDTAGGVITITGASDYRCDFGLAGVELVPSASLVMKQDILPSYAETVVGDRVAFSAAFANPSAINLQWQKISGGVTNDINTGVVNTINNGITTSTLTLNNVQLADSGSYMVKAVQANNSAIVAYSAAAPLGVSNTPTPVNNVIINTAGQTYPPGLPYSPWPVSTADNLIYGFQPTFGPGGSSPVGDFSASGECNFDPSILTDGSADITSLLTQTCGCGPSAAKSITYTFDTSSATYGFEITNITVFGGWGSHGRDLQQYQVQYSTVSDPATFLPLLTVIYNPSEAVSGTSITRTMLVPATGGTLIHNVAALKMNFDVSNPWPENGWEGYSEIVVGGKPSLALMPSVVQDVTPQAAVDVTGSQLIMQANFANYTSLQWQHNGINIPGATTTKLTMNNLQLTDAGNYVLVANNASGSTMSSACVVTVNPVPAATNNAVISIAEQTAPFASFAPTWNASALTTSLIYGTVPTASGDGDFTFTNSCSGPAILTDGSFGTNDFSISGTDLCFAAMGSDTNVGNYVTYTLPSSTYGYNITNIVIVAGWNDAGRDMLACTVYYATKEDPTTFLPLAVVSSNPVNPSGKSFDKATITPASGVLAANVVALKFDMTTPAGENGWSGYSEISVHGSLATAPVTATPPTLSKPVFSGGKLIMTGTGGTANQGYTWVSSTNVAAPAGDWKVVSTGTLDGSGSISNALPIDPAQPATFFRLRMP